jgi:antitoxin PrlF
MSQSYSIRSSKIGNSAGFRLPAEFYREHPQFANADGWIEVMSEDTAIIRIIPQTEKSEDTDHSLLMRLFLDFAIAEALKKTLLVPYTTEMSDAAHALIEGIEVEDDGLEDD